MSAAPKFLRTTCREQQSIHLHRHSSFVCSACIRRLKKVANLYSMYSVRARGTRRAAAASCGHVRLYPPSGGMILRLLVWWHAASSTEPLQSNVPSPLQRFCPYVRSPRLARSILKYTRFFARCYAVRALQQQLNGPTYRIQQITSRHGCSLPSALWCAFWRHGAHYLFANRSAVPNCVDGYWILPKPYTQSSQF